VTEKWRLLDYSSADPKMDLAINEAIFRSRRENLTPNTLRLWQGPATGVIGSSGGSVNHKECRKRGVEVVRALSVTADLLYIDTGSLNFAVTANTAFFNTRAIDYPPILSDYYILNAAIAEGLRKFSENVEANPEGTQINGRKISWILPKWFYDFLLFQVTLLINTDLEVYRKLIRTDRSLTEMPKITSLSRQLRKDIPLDEVKRALIEGFEKKLGIVFKTEEELTKDEQKAAKALLKAKYGLDKWNMHGIEPFLIGMGKTSLEVFVAYPPTPMCRQLIELVKDVTSDLQDDVTVRVWMRGKGSNQHGVYPEMSPALINAEKCSRIPAIIINGELKFDRAIPSRECLRSAVLAALPQE
jgi:lipoate-protein ligase A